MRELEWMAKAVLDGVPFLELPAIKGPRDLHAWMRARIADQDERGIVRNPENALRTGRGDCKSLSVLAAAVAQAYGWPWKWVTVGTDGRCFKHVYAVVRGEIVDGRADRPGVVQDYTGTLCQGF